jgi:hypothetical protein
VEGVTVIDTSDRIGVAAVTVMVVEPLTAPSAASRTEVPWAFEVTSPEAITTATLVDAELQVAELVMSAVDLSL